MTTDSGPLAERETTMANDHGTISHDLPDWYIQFQTDVLLQLPRPSQMTRNVALGWHGSREILHDVLWKHLASPRMRESEYIGTRKFKFPTWETIRTSTLNRTQLLTKLRAAGIYVSPEACEMFKSMVLVDGNFDLVTVCPRDLGYRSGVSRADMLERVKGLQLRLVPAMVGAQILLQLEGVIDDAYIVGMDPVRVASGDTLVFEIGTGLQLSGSQVLPNNYYSADKPWVFAQ